MKIELVEVAGFVAAFKALRLPFKLGERSQLYFNLQTESKNAISFYSRADIDSKDLKLLQTLIKKGDDEAKVVRGIEAYIDIEMPLYLMIELDTYRIGTDTLATSSSMHTDCKGLQGLVLQKEKGKIGGNYIYKRIEKFSYQALRRIYFSRKNHRLPEWQEFCSFIESLPMANELITIK